MTGTIAIVPVKRISGAKTRLSGRLTAQERQGLVLDLFDHVLAVLAASAPIDDIIVVTPDSEILRRAGAGQATGLPQPGDGLNQAIVLGRNLAIQRGAAGLVVVLADLPLLTAADINSVVERTEDTTVVLAPDRHGQGTNVLSIRPATAIEPAFGAHSLCRHRQSAGQRGLAIREYRSQGTGFDIDTPADFEEFQRMSISKR